MKTVRLFEYDSLKHADISESQLKRLKAFDDSYSRQKGNRRVFDWNANGGKTTSYVGVVRIPGLTLEILPKIDRPDANGDNEKKRSAQNNLLYMLSITSKVPIEERDIAGLKTSHGLLETLVAIFVRRLLDELRKGLEHNYIHHEENISILKGKLLFSQHIRHNASHQERAFVGFDEFIADTWLNRILKAACRKLLGVSQAADTQKLVREALAVLDEVSNCLIDEHHFHKVTLTRNNERFKVLLEFSRLVLLDQSPLPSAGREQTISLLFPMEQLFEEFIATIICRNADWFSLTRSEIHVQAKGMRSYLLERKEPKGLYFQLKPDIVVDRPDRRLILDTKWKCLINSAEDKKNNVSQADMYQMYAYATRYECKENVLLYPKVEGVEPATYFLPADASTSIRICQVDMSCDLRKERIHFLQKLKQVLSPEATTIIQ